MYFRSSSRFNSATQSSEGYYRIIESYRNEYGRVCHRTLYNAGFIKYDADKLITIQRILNDKLNRTPSLFDETDNEAVAIAEQYWNEMVANKKVDVSDLTYEKSKRMVDMNTIKNKGDTFFFWGFDYFCG